MRRDACSQVEEEQPLEPLPLKRQGRVLPEVRFRIRRMLTEAVCARGANLRGLGHRVLTPCRREQIEMPTTVRTGHEMGHRGALVWGRHRHSCMSLVQ